MRILIPIPSDLRIEKFLSPWADHSSRCRHVYTIALTPLETIALTPLKTYKLIQLLTNHDTTYMPWATVMRNGPSINKCPEMRPEEPCSLNDVRQLAYPNALQVRVCFSFKNGSDSKGCW